MTPEEAAAAQKQANHEFQDELVEAIWSAIYKVARKREEVSLSAIISALETVKTRHFLDFAIEKAVAEMKEVKDATI